MILEEVFRKIIEICRRNGASKVILFGSRAKETARERSDIDIAVCGVYDMEKLQEEIEDIPTLYTVDLVDLDTCENQLLLEDIEQYGRKIYEEV
ncbi:MAG: nucleotidyltransferase domain-containing protein [Blautia sp.]|jgi:predicted nucleotidyltransferase|nr:nucleotidyltransferase domain-containing protein [Blautia sp.]